MDVGAVQESCTVLLLGVAVSPWGADGTVWGVALASLDCGPRPIEILRVLRTAGLGQHQHPVRLDGQIRTPQTVSLSAGHNSDLDTSDGGATRIIQPDRNDDPVLT